MVTPVDVPLAILGLAFAVALVRAATGPSLADRAIATEVCLVVLVSAIALLSVREDAAAPLDAVVVAALFQFIATMSIGRLLEHKERRR